MKQASVSFSVKPEAAGNSKTSWWSSRSKLEKWLISCASCLVVLSVLLTSTLITTNRNRWFTSLSTAKTSVYQQVSPYVCLTPACVKAGWKESKHISDDQTGITEFGALRENLNRKMRALVEQAPAKDEPRYTSWMRLMYQQCMNQTTIDAYQATPIVENIIELGGWPVVENNNWDQRSFSWTETLIKLRKLGFNHNIFFAVYVGPDFKNSTKHIAQIDQGSLGLPNRKYFLKGPNDTTVRAYFETMVDMALALGAKNKTRVEQEMRDVIKFETQLANLSLPMEKRRNFTTLYNKMKLSKVMELAPTIEWRKLMESIFLDEIPLHEEFIVKAPSFITAVDRLLAESDPRVLANYLIFRTAFSSLPQLGQKWRKLTEKYDKALTGKSQERPRWDTCMKRLYGTFGVPMSAVYVKKHFDPESLERAQTMVNYIHNEFLKIVKDIEWMDDKTRRRALEKAKGIQAKIGYSKEILDQEKVWELFRGLELSENATFYANVQALRKYWTDYDIKKLREPYDKNDWKKFSQAATINAFYNSLENSIKFPAGILQGIFFDKGRPNYLNYGAIGYIIGHEITHGFDDRGRQFDKDGNNRNWWEHETDQKFQERAQCIVNQYNNFVIPEDKSLRLNGVNTQGENIADNGGLKQAFLGYQSYVRDVGVEPALPGLDYTPNQLFWISSANIWCAKIRLQSLKLRIQTGVHSPPRFRVIGPMVNSAHFAQSFKCPAGSPMNPVKKCIVW